MGTFIIISCIAFWIFAVWTWLIADHYIFPYNLRNSRNIELITEHLDKKPNKGTSYRVCVSVQPKWHEIIRYCFPDLKTNKEINEFIDSLFEDKTLELDAKSGLYGKYFRYLYFYDGVSGLELIWSHYHEGFVDNMEGRGMAFQSEASFAGKFWKKYADEENLIAQHMRISPSSIAFLGDYGNDSELSRFPYSSVINFFLDAQNNSGLGNFMVKKFPNDIQENFDKNQITYDPQMGICWESDPQPNKELYKPDLENEFGLNSSKWLESNGVEFYRQILKSQRFETPYYEIDIQQKFFEVDP